MIEVLLVIGIAALVTAGAFIGFRMAYDDYQIHQQLQELSQLKTEAHYRAMPRPDWTGITLPVLQSGSERFPDRLRRTAPNYETVFHTPLTTSIDTMTTMLSPTTPVLNWILAQTSTAHCIKLLRSIPPERYERVQIDGVVVSLKDFAAVDAACTAGPVHTLTLGQAKTLMAPKEGMENMVGPLCLEGTVTDVTTSACGVCQTGIVTTTTKNKTTCSSQWGTGVVTQLSQTSLSTCATPTPVNYTSSAPGTCPGGYSGTWRNLYSNTILCNGTPQQSTTSIATGHTSTCSTPAVQYCPAGFLSGGMCVQIFGGPQYVNPCGNMNPLGCWQWLCPSHNNT